MTRLVLVCGMPGAGKTTHALRIATTPDELATYDAPTVPAGS